MAITNVGGNTNGVNSPTSNYNHTGLALNNNDYMVIVVHIDCHSQGSNATVTVSDGVNLWSRLGFNASTASGHLQRTEVWSALNSGAATRTVNVAISGGYNSVSSCLSAYRGVDTSIPILDALGFTTNYTSTGSSSSYSQTVTTTGAMCVAFLTYDDQNNGGGGLSGAGFAHALNVSSGAGLVYSACSTADKVGTAGTQTEAWGTNDFWCVGGLTLKPFVTTESGTITTTLTKASQSLAGKESFVATATTHLTKPSLSLAGKVDVRGQMTTVLTKTALSLIAKQTFTGTVATALTKASQSLVGVNKFSAAITTTLTRAAMSTSGSITPVESGTITTRLTKASFALSGTEVVTGTATTALSKVQQVAMAPANISATITTALRPTSQIVNGTEQFIGAIVTALDPQGVIIHAETYELFVGTIVTTLGSVNMAAAGDEIFKGTIVTRLGSANGSVVANVVEALEIIEGPIVMTLPPFRPLVLGAMLGTPGDGKWFSWRYTDA